MLKINAVAFYSALSWLSRISGIHDEAVRNKSDEIGQLVTPADAPKLSTLGVNLRDSCVRLQGELVTLGASITEMSVARLVGCIEDRTLTYEQLGSFCEAINSRIRDELSLTSLFVIHRDRAKFLSTPETFFGQVVLDKFPSAVPDIQDAAKCLAFGQGTATAFHLMRVMEIGLKALSKSLGIPYAPSWESHLTQIADRIASRHKKKGIQWKRDEPFYRDVSGDLQTVKQAWRNPTMHVSRRYDSDEAEDIFRAVRSFMKRLSERLSEVT